MIWLILIIQTLQLGLCMKFVKYSRYSGLLINILCVSHLLLYVLPYLFNSRNYPEVGEVILFSSLGILIGTFIVSLSYRKSFLYKNDNHIEQALKGIRPLNNQSLVWLSYIFVSISLYSIYITLQSIGGINVMLIAAGGGAKYLDARVNSINSGMLGLLIWFGPVSLSYIFFDLLIETRKKKTKAIIFFILLISMLTGCFLLTIRHNTIAIFLMLFTVHTLVKGFSKTRVIIIIIFSTGVVYVFQAIRIGDIEDFSIQKITETRSDEIEHLDVTAKIISKVNNNGNTYLTHIKDIYIFLIPRIIWPNKPITSFLNREYFPNVARSGSEKAIGIVGEGYSMFGFFGVFILTIFFSYVISRLQYMLDTFDFSILALFIIISIIPLSYIGIRTGVFGKHLLSNLIMIFQVMLYLSISKIKIV